MLKAHRPLPIHPLAQGRNTINFLVWHDIIVREQERLVWFDTTIKLFKAQCKQLEQAGAVPITLNRALIWLQSGTQRPPKGAVVLCFDDNTTGILAHALPILQDYNWHLTLSAHTDYIGVSTRKDHNTWEVLRKAYQANQIELVNQTASHPPDLTKLTHHQRSTDFQRSRRAFTKHLTHTPTGITYPSGKWNNAVIQDALDAGFTFGLTEDHGVAESSANLMAIKRWSTHARWTQCVKAVQSSASL